jgi:lipooligosaccharide transport system ATP-binding protein
VAQTDNLDEELTVVQNLEVYAGYFGLTRRAVASRIQELLAFMSLSGREDSPIRELSGGLKRRLVIARALVNDPDLVVLDEPTTGLDPQARHLVWARLRELRARGVTLLLTTHYMEEAHQLCDRLVVVDQGRVLAEGRPRELVASRLPPHVLELPAAAAPAALPEGTRLEVHGDMAFVYSSSMDGLERLAEQAQGEYRIRSTTLEDLFLVLTGRDLRESD